MNPQPKDSSRGFLTDTSYLTRVTLGGLGKPLDPIDQEVTMRWWADDPFAVELGFQSGPWKFSLDLFEKMLEGALLQKGGAGEGHVTSIVIKDNVDKLMMQFDGEDGAFLAIFDTADINCFLYYLRPRFALAQERAREKMEEELKSLLA